MARVYFNGIGNISLNRDIFSFSLDDTYQSKGGKLNKSIVIELVTDLEAAEGICNFLLEEIRKIKQLKEESSKCENEKETSASEVEKPEVGIKLAMSNHNHSD